MYNKKIYLDNNATTPLAPEVKEAIKKILEQDKFGNPSSLHDFGKETRIIVSNALDNIYDLIYAPDTDDIIINSCATEGNNTVLQGIYNTYIRNNNKKNHIITTNVEHPSVMNCLQYLENLGARVTYLPVNSEGYVTSQQVTDAIDDTTILVSIMWANNETGVLFPIHEIAEKVKEKGILFHTDAAQVIGKINISVKNQNIDFLTFSGHKFHAPKGIGALYIKSGNNLPPLIHGGEQMGGFRGGTHNIIGIAAMGIAAKLAKEKVDEEFKIVQPLRDKFENDILSSIPDTAVNGTRKNRIPNTTNISFKGIEGEAFLWDLNENNIAASTGSACASGSEKASYVLSALGVSPETAHSSIRFSLSRYNTQKEVEYAVNVIKKITQRLRDISLTYKNNN